MDALKYPRLHVILHHHQLHGLFLILQRGHIIYIGAVANTHHLHYDCRIRHIILSHFRELTTAIVCLWLLRIHSGFSQSRQWIMFKLHSSFQRVQNQVNRVIVSKEKNLFKDFLKICLKQCKETFAEVKKLLSHCLRFILVQSLPLPSSLSWVSQLSLPCSLLSTVSEFLHCWCAVQCCKVIHTCR